jgi:hypothetical protein
LRVSPPLELLDEHADLAVHMRGLRAEFVRVPQYALGSLADFAGGFGQTGGVARDF